MADPAPRNIAFDNLRVAAMLLGLALHGLLPFKATTIGRFPIHDRLSHILADCIYFALHDFRMQLFFLVAGFAAASLQTKYGWQRFWHNRVRRIVVPMLLAFVTVAPMMRLLFQHHENGTWDTGSLIEYVGPYFHLWFLYLLLIAYVSLTIAQTFIYSIVSMRVLTYANAIVRLLLASSWLIPVLAVICVPLLWEMRDWWVDTPQSYLPSRRLVAYYLLFFFVGVMMRRHADLLPEFGKRWGILLLSANLILLPAMLMLTFHGLAMPVEDVIVKCAAILTGTLYTWLMIAGSIGLFQAHFATRNAVGSYLAESSYWCYLAGFPLQVALQIQLADSALSIMSKFLIVNVLTFTLLILSYELVVRHSWLGLLLNGKRPQGQATVSEPTVISARVPTSQPSRDRSFKVLLFSPLPWGSGVGGEGEDRPLSPKSSGKRQAQTPHPQPLSPQGRGEEKV